ncbi:hypothetical protein F2P56_004549 [Juglans regia]|uniref:WAT1-related protein n=2 Tax=Juglans regia TaxID=51240 RepID=A0A2I4ET49_JUGRE|nr:WAT1-related protein At1g43650-like isoform X1 [Juglans regia]XP_035542337.1 WAT1-related protein At1g43650-like isoform X1 [Juglans regia]KAF5477945.1 hypothetical protein F2P56_004549 [Juglans regia]
MNLKRQYYCITMEAYASYGAMILIQFAYGGANILTKIALEKGLNQLVFVVYRHIIAMLLLGPFAYVLERKHRPPLSFSVITKIFLLASFGTTIHLNVYYAGLAYTSPTVASALSNVVPCLTFLIAVILRMETVKITSTRGQAKMLGTLVCIGGALTFTFWKGRYLLKGFVHRPLINICSTNTSVCGLSHGKDNWIKGSALILISHVAWSAWLILQAVVSKVYPARLSLNVLICFFASLQSSFLALFFARNPTLWKLEWNMQLLTIIYSGVVISALVYYLQTWCISNKGPVFAAMFSPLLLIIVGIFSAIFFAERIRLGSLAGAFLIIVGLYIVLWAKHADNVVTRVTENGKGLNDNKMLQISINETVRNSVTNETK